MLDIAPLKKVIWSKKESKIHWIIKLNYMYKYIPRKQV